MHQRSSHSTSSITMHVYVNTHLYQCTFRLLVQESYGLFISTLVYVNAWLYQLSKYQCTVLFIATLLYISLQYQSSKPVLPIRIIFDDRIWIQLLKMSGSSSQWCDVDNNKVVCQGDYVLPYQHIHYDVNLILG
jgi:hypothetical protein